MIHTRKPSPLVGEGVNRQVDGRGKCEQKRKKRFLQNGIKYLPVILERSEESRHRLQELNDFNLCTQTCPYRLARLGTSLRVRGKRTTKEESNQVL